MLDAYFTPVPEELLTQEFVNKKSLGGHHRAGQPVHGRLFDSQWFDDWCLCCARRDAVLRLL